MAYDAGELSDAKDYMARAVHTMLDGLSPAHVDANGKPYPYPGSGDTPRHSPLWFGDETTRAISPIILQTARGQLTSACSVVTGH